MGGGAFYFPAKLEVTGFCFFLVEERKVGGGQRGVNLDTCMLPALTWEGAKLHLF